MVDQNIKQIIQFKGKYKKYSNDTKGCTIPEFLKLSKRLKYFRFDATNGFAQLVEDVPGKKYKEFEKNRKVAAVMKYIKHSHEKQLSAWNKLEDMQKRADAGKKKFEKLEGEINKAYPKKGPKPNPDIEKLKTQIADDLKEFTKIAAQMKQVKSVEKDLLKEFATELKMVETADPGDTKFGKLMEKELSSATLKKRIKKCEKGLSTLDDERDLAMQAAEEGDKKAANVSLKACLNELKSIQRYEKEYSKIKKKHKDEIKVFDDKKMKDLILKNIDYFVEMKGDAERLYGDALTAVKNAKL